MQLVPVLELRHGKCVHTEPKNAFTDQVIRENLSERVERWIDEGVSRIHVVDVDAIESGIPENVDLIASFKKAHPEIAIQVLGGVKSVESAYIWFDAGVDYIVLNGKALRQQNLLDDLCVAFPNSIMVELDSRNGQVAVGSGEPTFSLEALANQLEEDGVVGVVITEIPENGHVNYNNLMSVIEFSKNINLPVFANGGIESVSDLKQALSSQAQIIQGILLGKPLHNGFNLSDAHLVLAQQ